jgi:hypothetical protein
VWALRCDVHVLDHDGNLPGACVLATLGALLAFRRPDAEVVAPAAGGGGGAKARAVLLSPELREPLPLSLHELPLAVTFALFQARACACACPVQPCAVGSLLPVPHLVPLCHAQHACWLLCKLRCRFLPVSDDGGMQGTRDWASTGQGQGHGRSVSAVCCGFKWAGSGAGEKCLRCLFRRASCCWWTRG